MYTCGLLQNSSLTLSKIVSCRKPNGFEFTVCNKLNPKVSSTGPHIHWALLPAVSTENGGGAEWAISHLNVVKLAFPRWFYAILFIKVQSDALSWRCYKAQQCLKLNGGNIQRRNWQITIANITSWFYTLTFYYICAFSIRRIFLRKIRRCKGASIRLFNPGTTQTLWCYSWVVFNWNTSFPAIKT